MAIMTGPATATTTSSGLDKLRLKDTVHKNLPRLYRIPIDELNCTFGVVTRGSIAPLQATVLEGLRKERSTDVMIAFAVRRPG